MQDVAIQLIKVLLGWGAILLLVKFLIWVNTNNKDQKTLQDAINDLNTAIDNLKDEVEKSIKQASMKRLEKIFAVISLAILVMVAIGLILTTTMPMDQTMPYSQWIENGYCVIAGSLVLLFLVGLVLILRPTK